MSDRRDHEPPRSIETRVIHAGQMPSDMEGAVVMPTFQSAMYRDTPGVDAEPRYIRYSNTPNHRYLHGKLAELLGAEDALVTGSGMAAISSALLSVLGAGDRVLVQRSLYGGTYGFVTHHLPRWGIDVTLIDADDPGSWAAELTDRTKAIYLESISNPTMRVGALDEAVAFAREHGLVSMVDNTFATPVNFRPLEIGFDLELHSATKYLNGHSDLVAGVLAGPERLMRPALETLRGLGGSLEPDGCFLLDRGLKTLALRVRHQNGSALTLARALEKHRAVRRVHYPGLESHPDHERATHLFSGDGGGYGGMLAFELDGGADAAQAFMGRLTLPVVAPSLGGVESLVTRPVATSHRTIPRQEREAMGVTDEMIRVSVGIEGTDDLVADFLNALG
ncbi:MAG: PLP-dependent aspartate aminotransferase family protein [Acidobacteriota bacterium]|jgi:cystathionine beta-lyase/cystathionine gamma-synthase